MGKSYKFWVSFTILEFCFLIDVLYRFCYYTYNISVLHINI